MTFQVGGHPSQKMKNKVKYAYPQFPVFILIYYRSLYHQQQKHEILLVLAPATFRMCVCVCVCALSCWSIVFPKTQTLTHNNNKTCYRLTRAPILFRKSLIFQQRRQNERDTA